MGSCHHLVTFFQSQAFPGPTLISLIQGAGLRQELRTSLSKGQPPAQIDRRGGSAPHHTCHRGRAHPISIFQRPTPRSNRLERCGRSGPHHTCHRGRAHPPQIDLNGVVGHQHFSPPLKSTGTVWSVRARRTCQSWQSPPPSIRLERCGRAGIYISIYFRMPKSWNSYFYHTRAPISLLGSGARNERSWPPRHLLFIFKKRHPFPILIFATWCDWVWVPFLEYE